MSLLHNLLYRIVKYIGSGQFGTVNLAMWTQQYIDPMEVAVKVCRAGMSGALKTKFLMEAAIMGQFRHANVVKLYGVVTMSEQVCIDQQDVPSPHPVARVSLFS